MDPNNALDNLSSIFQIIEDDLGIPQLLDPEDVNKNPDDKSIVAVSLESKKFSCHEP